jgi:prophage regulatory protein
MKDTTNNQLLTIKEVQQSLGICRAKIYSDMQIAGFPKPIKLGKSSRWVHSEVQDWIRQQVERRNSLADMKRLMGVA